MSDDDLLTASLRALRESSDGTSERAQSTRTDILARLRIRQKRRRRLTVIALPLAAALMIGTAWAAVTGRLPGMHGQLAPSSPPAASSAGMGAHSLAPGTPLIPSASDALPDAGSSSEAAPSVAPSASAANNMHSTRDTGRVVSAREQALYTKAHQAHFTAHDPEAALRGWNGYLAAFPDGEFALEAKYNRAISLVRTGRRAEAVQALTPFAKGAYGGYRQAEARDLLDALGGDAGPSSGPR